MPQYLENLIVYTLYELFPDADPDELEMTIGGVNGFSGKEIDDIPLFKNKRHALAEICAAGAYYCIAEQLNENETNFCKQVIDYMIENQDIKGDWDIRHIPLD